MSSRPTLCSEQSKVRESLGLAVQLSKSIMLGIFTVWGGAIMVMEGSAFRTWNQIESTKNIIVKHFCRTDPYF